MRARTLLLAGLVVLVPLAGCLGAEVVPDERRFSASGGSASPGWAYDGAGLVPASATLDGWVNNVQNAGQINVSFRYQDAAYVVVFDTFEEASGKTFQDGGVAFELPEHGESGNGDAALPLLHAAVAAWGQATVTKDGAPITAEPWSAHLMVSHDTVRGADGKIVNAAGAPYDPAKAADAKRVENDPQALFFIKHPQGETYARPPLAGTVGDEVNGNEQNIAIADIPSEKGALGVAINYTIDASTLAPAAVGRVTLRVVNASGETVATLTEDETVTPGTVTIGAASIPAELIDGPLQVEINGVGFYSVVIDYVVTYQDTPFIVLTWDDVTLG